MADPISRRVRSTAFGVGITVVIIGGLAYVLSRTKAGDTIIASLRGFGSNVGQSIVAPFTGLVTGVTTGAKELTQVAATQGADFQEFVTGNRNAIKDYFEGNNEDKNRSDKTSQTSSDQKQTTGDTGARTDSTQRPSASVKTTVNLDKIFSDKATTQRIEQTIRASSQGNTTRYTTINQGVLEAAQKKAGITDRFVGSSLYGGYGTARTQEESLRKAILESQQKYGQYFSTGTNS